ncbi:hypothetical protein F7231_26850 [Fibrella aestuarina]|uniref:Uncharacterized protein n=1 Tax=Fibrivirga algicola TaxID=2950420 RepID=A0ABX0QSF3_9BACT|nr:hypothetical protein [Fibrivirga algicola]
MATDWLQNLPSSSSDCPLHILILTGFWPKWFSSGTIGSPVDADNKGSFFASMFSGNKSIKGQESGLLPQKNSIYTSQL